MNYKVVVKTPAERDISEVLEWYSEKSSHLPHKFLKNLHQTIKRIKRTPQGYQKRYAEIRLIFVSNFPYAVYYTLEEEIVYIHAVLHTKRNPKTGIDRV